MCIFIGSCSQYLYAPSGSAIPDLREKGDLRVQGNVGLQNPSFANSAAIAYAPSGNWGLRAAYTVSGAVPFDAPFSAQAYPTLGTGAYAEMSAGRFRFIRQQNSQGEGVSTMLFGGFGSGSFTTALKDDIASSVQDKAKVGFRKAYICPAAILRQPYFSLGVSAQMGLVDFHSGVFQGDRQMFRHTFQVFQKQNNYFVVEPTIQLWTVPCKNVQVQAFFTATSMPVELSTPTVWGIGLQYSIGKTKNGRPIWTLPPPFPTHQSIASTIRANPICKLKEKGVFNLDIFLKNTLANPKKNISLRPVSENR